MLTHLVTHAVRYTHHETVLIRCLGFSKQHGFITVVDAWVGIEEQDPSQIFESYFRVSGRNNPFLPNIAVLSVFVTFLAPTGHLRAANIQGAADVFPNGTS